MSVHLSADHISNLLDYPELVQVLREAFASEDYHVPPRHHHDHGENTLLLMPAFKGKESMGVKVVTVFPGNTTLPSILGTYLLMDGTTGEIICTLDGAALTRTRTAAASALAADYLAPAKAQSMLMMGTGVLAPELIRAHMAHRPIKNIHVWGRNLEKASRVAEQLSSLPIPVDPVVDLPTAIKNSDIISTATLASEPILKGNDIKPGTHLDLVGSFKPDMREVDDEAIARARIYVDSEMAAIESGDLKIPLDSGLIDKASIQADLFQLCRKQNHGRTDEQEITLFKSVGHALEDLAAATYFYQKFQSQS